MVRCTAQADIISIVLISGILIALVGAAYLWGVPLIEKRSTLTQFQTAQDWLSRLDRAITDVASMGGTVSLDIPFGTVSVLPYDINNTITFEFLISQPLIWEQIYLGQTVDVFTETGRYGIAQPYILTLSSEPMDTQTKITASLHYRELIDSKGYRIALLGSGQGRSRLTISYVNTTRVAGGAANGGDLLLTFVRIDLA